LLLNNQVDLPLPGRDAELNLVLEDVAAVDHAEVLAFVFHHNHEEKVLAIYRAIPDGERSVLVRKRSRQRATLHFENESVFHLTARPGVIARISPGIIGGKSHQRKKSENTRGWRKSHDEHAWADETNGESKSNGSRSLTVRIIGKNHFYVEVFWPIVLLWAEYRGLSERSKATRQSPEKSSIY
jgi:hypothetical protein